MSLNRRLHPRHRAALSLSLSLVQAPALSAPAGSRPATAQGVREVKFAQVGQQALLLDLFLPERGPTAGLIVWVHGGAWRSGSRAQVDLLAMRERGWAVASVDYRLSPQAKFPAQVHDIKAAIRYLRAHAADHGYPPAPFVVAGSSAGGHLAALVGTSNGHRALEGEVGSELAVSSDVQAIVSLYGASNLTSILAQSTPHGLSVRVPALELLFGAAPGALPELERLASPVFHVGSQSPPLFLLHGDQDVQMPINQAHELAGAYERHQRPLRFTVVYGAGHGGPAFTAPAQLGAIDAFLRQHLTLPGPPRALK